jgi:ATP-binding cassette subfamily B protein
LTIGEQRIPPDDLQGDHASGGNPSTALDPLAYLQKSVTEPKSVRGLLGIATRAVGMARRASPRLFWVNVLLGIVNAALLGLQVLLGKLALQALFRQPHGGSIHGIILPLIGLAATSALGGLASNSQVQLQRLLGEEVQRLTWSGIIDVTTRVRLETFEAPEFFDALQRVKTNAVLRPVTLTQGFIQLVTGLFSIVGLTVALLLMQPILVPVLFAGGVPLWLISRQAGKIEFRFRVGQTPQLRLNEYLIRTLSGRSEAKEIRAFQIAPVLRRRWLDNYAEYLADYRAHIRRRLVLGGLNALVTTVVTSGTLGLLIWLIVNGRISLASGGAALLAVRLLGGYIQQLFIGIGDLFESALFLRDFDDFLNREVPGSDADAGSTPSAGLSRSGLSARGSRSISNDPARAALSFAELSLRDVGFQYPGTTAWALRDISITLKAGESIALVGENGSGKTTLAKLIGQLFRPTTGEMRWGGAEVSTLDPEVLRGQIGLIFQDFVRYQLSARENIAFGRPECSDDQSRLEFAARQGGADRFLRALPDGYDTWLGKEYLGGIDLSLGQWQRMALARAFFRDAKLLVLDEPTASLDARSEHELFEHVRGLSAGRALVLISHRFSTVRDAGRIYVMDKGRIIEQGDHRELTQLGGRYAELFELQASAYR